MSDDACSSFPALADMELHLSFGGETHAAQPGADVTFDLNENNSEQQTLSNELIMALFADPQKLSDSTWADSPNWHADGSIAKSKLHPLALVGLGANTSGSPVSSRRGWFKVYSHSPHASNGHTVQRKAAFAEVLLRLTVEMQAINITHVPQHRPKHHHDLHRHLHD